MRELLQLRIDDLQKLLIGESRGRGLASHPLDIDLEFFADVVIVALTATMGYGSWLESEAAENV